jgi:hypothetical protein
MSNAAGLPHLQIIGAGFGRSGTTSLRQALRTLGYDPCYHMQIALTRLHSRFWVRAAALAKSGEPVNFQRFFRNYRATVDWPSCEFYRQLMEAFPDAKVLLNTRDPDAWYDSMRETLWAIQDALPRWFPGSVSRMHDDVIWVGRFNGEFTDRQKAIGVYLGHLEEVRRSVPPGRLLEFDVKDGWQPLCAFLGQPVPQNTPFPHLNDRRFFRRVLLALRVAEWLVPALLALGLAAVGWMALR